MDAILKQIDAKNALRQTLVVQDDTPTPEMEQAREKARLAHEQRLQEITAYKERVKGHMRKLIESEHKWTKYPPLDAEHLHVVALLAEEFGLVSHEFGEEGHDRFVIVYKPEHQPSDEEIARLSLKYNEKLDDEKVEKILADAAQDEQQDEAEAAAAKARKKKKTAEEEEEEVGTLHAVGTVKRVRRNAAEAIEEIRMQKKMEAPGKAEEEIDSLFQEAE